jgi:hypothetical protein
VLKGGRTLCDRARIVGHLLLSSATTAMFRPTGFRWKTKRSVQRGNLLGGRFVASLTDLLMGASSSSHYRCSVPLRLGTDDGRPVDQGSPICNRL